MNAKERNKILIVDDDDMVIMALADILSTRYAVFSSKDGLDGLEKAEKIVPDLILLDIVMPGMDGHSFISALKGNEKTNSIPVIIISSLSEVEDERKGLALGAADYITKPFFPEIVKLRVHSQIKLINQTREIINKEADAKSARAKMEFLMQMSHDMLTPMNAIMGMTVIAMRERNSETTTDCLKEIDVAARCLLSLIRELLDSSSKAIGGQIV